jgi:UDP-3-O-[3-hydroxymyristoyl] glucosamine N-acyltransferase
VVVGADGFGFTPNRENQYQKVAQIGNVIIEDHVEIGANSTVDRATLGSTIIRKGAKLDNLIQIAHNVVIGKNTVIAAQSGVAGSSKVGENCMIAGQVGIAGHLEIANRTSLGAQTGVSKSITEEGQRHFGTPSFDIKEYFRSYAIFKKLPDFNYRLRELEKRVPHPIENGAQSQKD